MEWSQICSQSQSCARLQQNVLCRHRNDEERLSFGNTAVRAEVTAWSDNVCQPLT